MIDTVNTATSKESFIVLEYNRLKSLDDVYKSMKYAYFVGNSYINSNNIMPELKTQIFNLYQQQ